MFAKQTGKKNAAGKTCGESITKRRERYENKYLFSFHACIMLHEQASLGRFTYV